MPIVAAAMFSRTGRPRLRTRSRRRRWPGSSSASPRLGGMASAASVWLRPSWKLSLRLATGRDYATPHRHFQRFAIAALDGFGVPAPGTSWPVGVAKSVFAVMAIAHATAQALAHARLDEIAEPSRCASAQDRSLLRAIDDLVAWHDCKRHVLKANAAAMKLVGAPRARFKGAACSAACMFPSRRPFSRRSATPREPGDHRRPVRLRAGEEGDGAVRRSRGRAAGRRAGTQVISGRDASPRWKGGLGGIAGLRGHRRDPRRSERSGVQKNSKRRAPQPNAPIGRKALAATVGHELRTPLNAVISIPEILRDALVQQRRAPRGTPRSSTNSGQHLLGVVNTLLEPLRGGSGKSSSSQNPWISANSSPRAPT